MWDSDAHEMLRTVDGDSATDEDNDDEDTKDCRFELFMYSRNIYCDSFVFKELVLIVTSNFQAFLLRLPPALRAFT